jgi:hypothetical protein
MGMQVEPMNVVHWGFMDISDLKSKMVKVNGGNVSTKPLPQM